MVLVPGGTFAMGSADFYPEERPVHPVRVQDGRVLVVVSGGDEQGGGEQGGGEQGE